MLKRQSKEGVSGIQHNIGKFYDLKNDIGNSQTLGVVGSLSNDSMQDTFLHEVFHAIVQVMDLKETETEENYVCRLAAVFAEEVSINVKPPIWCRLIRCGDGRTAVRHLP